MVKEQSCPKHKCSWWGIPLEKQDSRTLRQLLEEEFRWRVSHESGMKCSRDPRFQKAPDAEDYFDLVIE